MSKSLLSLLLVFAFSKSSYALTLWGPKVRMGAGSASVFVEKEGGSILKIGVAFDDGALMDLPPQARQSFDLEMPDEIPPYSHVGIDWNPAGHAPKELGEAHFDFHFYFVGTGYLSLISCGAVDASPLCARRPSPELVPPNHFATRVVPRMGAHYYDGGADAFCGKGFSATFVYGYYNGALDFIEPMITRSWLLSGEHYVSVIPQPKKFERAGFYPLSYAIDYQPNEGLHRVILQDLVPR